MVAAAQFWASLAERDSTSASTALALARDAVSQSHSPFLDGWLAIMDAVYRFEHGQVGSAARLLEESTETGMIRDTVNLIRAGLDHHVDNAALEISEFRGGIIRDQLEFFNRVRIGLIGNQVI